MRPGPLNRPLAVARYARHPPAAAAPERAGGHLWSRHLDPVPAAGHAGAADSAADTATLAPRALVRRLARIALRLAGMRLEPHGLERLPQPCIVVANHSSYLDGVVLCAILPASFSFVIKREMAAVPLAGTLLRSIGAEFVERGNRVRGARDARRLLRQAKTGQALVFFPEGTFGIEVGLRHFHIGAFATALRADLPLLPVAIRGTRHCLPRGVRGRVPAAYASTRSRRWLHLPLAAAATIVSVMSVNARCSCAMPLAPHYWRRWASRTWIRVRLVDRTAGPV